MVKRYVLFAAFMVMTGFLCRIICPNSLNDTDTVNKRMLVRKIAAYVILIFTVILTSFIMIGDGSAGCAGALAASYFLIKRKNFFDVAAVSSASVIIASEIMRCLTLG